MLDQWTTNWVRPPLIKGARRLQEKGLTADQLTMTGFVMGMTAIPLLALQLYIPALLVIVLNRLIDGLDGALARLTKPSDAGGFLDITLDFIFYSGVVLGFAYANPEQNSLAACLLVFSFMGTGASFLAYAIMAEKHALSHQPPIKKSLHYLSGLAEGTETIIIFILFCLLPEHFPQLATGFALICLLSTGIRIWDGYRIIKRAEAPPSR